MAETLKFKLIYTESCRLPNVPIDGEGAVVDVTARINVFRCDNLGPLLVERAQDWEWDAHPDLPASSLMIDPTAPHAGENTDGRLLRHCATLADNWFRLARAAAAILEAQREDPADWEDDRSGDEEPPATGLVGCPDCGEALYPDPLCQTCGGMGEIIQGLPA